MMMQPQPLFRIAPLSLAIASAFFTTERVIAAPVFTSGNANVTQNSDQTLTTVDISASEYETLQWSEFNLRSNETVVFNQLSNNSVAVNQIGDSSASEVFGTINANGHVYLVNTNGFVFNNDTNINTAGFLASTFTTTLNGSDDQLTISGDSTGSIDIQGFNTGESNQYIAFYSPNISIGEQIETTSINLGSGDAHFQTAKGIQSPTIEIAGLPTGFAIDTSNLSNTSESFDILGDPTIQLSGENSKLVINQNDMNAILDSTVPIPELINAADLTLASENDMTVSNEINLIGSSIDSLSLLTSGNISVERAIFGTALSLNLTTGYGLSESDRLNTHVTITDNLLDDTDYSYLGGNTGLGYLFIDSGKIRESRSIKANIIDINGSLILQQPSSRFSLYATESIDISGPISSLGATNIDIFSPSISLTGIGKATELNPGNSAFVEDITIYTDSLSLSGSYIFSESLILNNYSQPNIDLLLGSDLYFYGDTINLDDSVFQTVNGNNYSLSFGDGDNRFSSISLVNTSTEQNLTLSEMNFFLENRENGSDLSIGGELSTSFFHINEGIDGFKTSMFLDGDLVLKDLVSLGLWNTSVDSTLYMLSAQASASEPNQGAYIYDFVGQGLDINGFNAITLTGSNYSVNSGDLNLTSDNIIVDNSADTINLASVSGALTLSSDLIADQHDVNIKTQSGSISLSGIQSADTIYVQQTVPTNSVTHYFDGDYIANNSIELSGLNKIESTSNLSFTSDLVNLTGSEVVSNENISITAQTSHIGKIIATDISISGNTSSTGATYLNGDLNAENELSFHLDAIHLENDITLSGYVNLFENKQFDSATSRYWYLNPDESLGEKVASINGTEDVTFNLSNTDIYIFDIGAQEALSSLSINGIDDNHSGNLSFVGRPNIAGTLGLSIHGDWYWQEAGNIEFITDNYNLDLSGVTINAAGTVTFNTGAGDLSLGHIGTLGTTTDLIIEDTNTLSFYGDLNLIEPAQAYIFENVNAIRLYTDLVIGSEDAPIIVDFGGATIDGTYSLTIYSDELSLGTIGSNIALQNLSIFSSGDIEFSEDINLVGSVDVTANSFNLTSRLATSGLDINISTIVDINMGVDSSISAENGSISLISDTGNINLGTLLAKDSVWIESKLGSINNSINDYISDDSTSTNITASELTLLGKLGIGESVASPIVIDYQGNGAINAESDGNIYIANLADAPTNSTSRIFDSSSSNNIAIIDAYNQLQLSSLNAYIEPQYETTLGLIDHFSWQTVGEEKIKKIQRPSSTPNLYYGRDGWRLGYFGK